jgi:hypothetical protein
MIEATLILTGLNFVVYFGLKIWQAWDDAEVMYTLREAYREGRKKLILGV